MKVLMFDIRESEKPFFQTHKFRDFDITLREESLNDKTKLTDEELNETCVISVYRSSILTSDILKKFKNIIVKFGRYRPNFQKHFDEVLGVELASTNQYAKRIS